MLSSVIEFLVLLSQFSLFGSEAKAEGRKKRKEEILRLLNTLSQFLESASKLLFYILDCTTISTTEIRVYCNKNVII